MVVMFARVRAWWRAFMAGRVWAMRSLSEVARISLPTAMRLMAVLGWKGRILEETHDCAAGGLERLGMSPLPTVTVTAMPVPAKARRMSGLASKILMRSMVVWDLRKAATVEGGGRLSATVP